MIKRFDSRPWVMLIIRSILFLGFQVLIAVALQTSGATSAWHASASWWPIAVILTNLVCLVLLNRFYRQDGLRFWDVFRIERQFLKQDVISIFGFLLIAGPLGYFPNIFSAKWLFGDPKIALDLLVRPLPVWAAVTSFALFPLLQGITEIPTYTLFAQTRLEAQGMYPWLTVALASFSLSAQHIFAPLILDWRFILYRMVMFLPFAVLIVLVMRPRPRLMPYIAVVHMLMDMSVAIMFLAAIE